MVLGSFSAPPGHRQQRQRDRHHADPDPLASPQLEAEETLGEHGEEDEAASEHRLADRDRGEGEGGHVQRERHRRDAPADAPPLGAKEIARAAQRMAHVDVGCGDRPSVFEEEREVGSQCGQQRTEQAYADGQGEFSHRGVLLRASKGASHRRLRRSSYPGSRELILSDPEKTAGVDESPILPPRPLAFGRDPDDVPGQVAALQRRDQPGGGIELPASETVTGGGREGVVVVVPGLSQARGASQARLRDSSPVANGRPPKK